jgi:DNA topoisomerase-1
MRLDGIGIGNKRKVEADAPDPDPEPAAAPAAAASVGLVYVSDAMPGHRRVRRGTGFAYRRADGSWLRDRAEVERIRRLAIPPAYSDVWICPIANGHLQATARDARGRKQYRYHALWNEQRGDDKFERLLAFGRALPRIRARVRHELRQARASNLERALVLATIVRLLDTTFLRVGNDEYARSNGSYGLTTLRRRHAGVKGGRLALSFRGKSGIAHSVTVDDPRIASVVRRCQQLPGQELFQYEDEDGLRRSIDSADVNDYLAEAAGERFTAKDFRTWHASVQALELLRAACAAVEPGEAPRRYSAAAASRGTRKVLVEVAARLGNTPAVCRKSYVHPDVLGLGDLLGGASEERSSLCLRLDAGARPRRGLQAAECRLIGLLEQGEREARARRAAEKPAPSKRSRQRRPRAASGASAAGAR